ncbi:putative methyltransferase (TIGR04325 family) [Rhodoblastus acidophilus]|uniref:methyltransferase, TIGR04325 family n=1 Tax=Rhodoblastus acidophilus TaxID=1074 RepID=UPI002224426C|nr:methyltransferase, TIGR04325 family [Rhodoblastus acidophilus]MCW2283195.1 putative methyltransferase (TIGR04325 family) [Rhodoblastus acidophilus]MCW2332055.1 putative methyltransferase (TIGR04325 family) [Rhodoblastus acidophilus]
MASIARAVISMLSRTSLGKIAGAVPGVENLYRDLAWTSPRLCGQHFGSYATYDEALTAIPKKLAKGWDHSELNAADHFQPSMFASLFWLRELLRPGDRIVDFGGSVGNLYYAFTGRSPLPEGASWHIIEVPATAEKGRRLAERRGASNLNFWTGIEDVGSYDILFSAGCLQYMDTDVTEFIPGAKKPRAVIINKIPLGERPQFWTLQNLERYASPYRVFNEDELLCSMKEQGYRVRDRWPVSELKIEIPFHPELFLNEQAGLVFERG